MLRGSITILLIDKSAALLEKKNCFEAFLDHPEQRQGIRTIFSGLLRMSVACVQLLPSLVASGPHTWHQTLCLRR